MDRIKIRTFQPNEWRKYRKLRLSSLAESPDAFGSSLEHEQKRTDTDWSSRLTLSDSEGINFPLLADLSEEAVGLAWGRIHKSDMNTAHVYQMWVEPDQRGQGIGGQLLKEILKWANSQNVKKVALAVACSNSPAKKLYLSEGFIDVGETEPLKPGSEIGAQLMQLDLEI